jgi:hypothetical protein
MTEYFRTKSNLNRSADQGVLLDCEDFGAEPEIRFELPLDLQLEIVVGEGLGDVGFADFADRSVRATLAASTTLFCQRDGFQGLADEALQEG